MFKVRLKKRTKIICILIFVGMIVAICINKEGRNRHVLEVSVESVEINKNVNWDNGALNKQQQAEIKANQDNYRYLDYTLAVKNKSNNIMVGNLYIYPKFFGNTKSIIFWFDSTDELEDDVRVHTNFTRECGRRVIVYSKGLSDDDLIKMSKNVKFKFKYHTYKTNSKFKVFSYRSNSQVFDYKIK